MNCLVTGEIAQWLGLLTALAEDLSLDSSTHMLAHSGL